MLRRASAILLAVTLFLSLLAGCRQGAAVGPTPASADPTVAFVPKVVTRTAVPGAQIPRIRPQELWPRLEGGEAITIVDVRSAGEYEAEHIVGAINLPSGEVAQRWNELPRDRLLVFYCT